jgi:hypothetical protein
MFAIRIKLNNMLCVENYIGTDGNVTQSCDDVLTFSTEQEAKEYAENNVKMEYSVIRYP